VQPGFDADVAFDAVARSLAPLADADRGGEMTRYMRGKFPYLGIGAPDRRRATKETVRSARRADADALLAFVDRCWAAPEREYQYVATDALREGRGALRPEHLASLRRLITTGSWWDTVDAIAPWPIGSLVERYPDVVATMDDWIGDDDFWVARSALLHQLHFKERTDADRLFRYVLHVADSDEFFLRKAAGWALRQYARTDPDAVSSFVAANESVLSPLTRREATKHL